METTLSLIGIVPFYSYTRYILSHMGRLEGLIPQLS
jgi:hypothetical protein